MMMMTDQIRTAISRIPVSGSDEAAVTRVVAGLTLELVWHWDQWSVRIAGSTYPLAGFSRDSTALAGLTPQQVAEVVAVTREMGAVLMTYRAEREEAARAAETAKLERRRAELRTSTAWEVVRRANGHAHVVAKTDLVGYTGGVSRDQEPRAAGGICVVEHCVCGDTRKRNENAGFVEQGDWGLRIEDLLEGRASALADAELERRYRDALARAGL